MASSMEAYDRAQALILEDRDRDDVEMALVREYPELNAQGLVPTILRRAYRDLAEI